MASLNIYCTNIWQIFFSSLLFVYDKLLSKLSTHEEFVYFVKTGHGALHSQTRLKGFFDAKRLKKLNKRTARLRFCFRYLEKENSFDKNILLTRFFKAHSLIFLERIFIESNQSRFVLNKEKNTFWFPQWDCKTIWQA